MEKPHVKTARPLAVTVLSIWNFIFALFGLFVFILYFTPMRPPTIEIGEGVEGTTYDLLLAVGILVISLIHFSVGLGEWEGRKWSLRAQRILAIPFLFGFPLGTVYALLVYLRLSTPEALNYFS